MAKPIKVVAIQPGHYVQRREIGDEFFIADEKAFSSRWMQKVEAKAAPWPAMPKAEKPEPVKAEVAKTEKKEEALGDTASTG